MNPPIPQAPQPSPEHSQPVGAEQPVVMPEQVAAPRETPAAAANNSGQPAAAHLTASDVAAAIAQMPATPTPVVPTSVTPPPTAADQDVIEPEWVEQAEATIARTAGDPHAEEEAVEALQIDYLQKRYGHTVKKPDQTA